MINRKTNGLIDAAPVFHALIAAQQQDEARAAQLQALTVRMINAFLECGAQPIAAFK